MTRAGKDFDARPFENLEEMHSLIKEKWNTKVSNGDTVYTPNGENVKLILCHYPILMWKDQHYGSILLYGHVHNSVEEHYFKKCLLEMDTEVFFDRRRGDKVLRAYNVGCMMPYINYEPRTLEEIVMGNERFYNEQEL